MFGFPDGYVTDYQKAARPPLKSHHMGGGWPRPGVLGPCLSPDRTKVRTTAWLAALIVLVLVALAAQVGIPWYFGTHLGLDNGIGG